MWLACTWEKESKVAQWFPTLCNPVDCSLPGSSIRGILQARILEGGVISFSRGSSRPRDWTQVSWIAGRCFTLWATREAPVLGRRWWHPLQSSCLENPMDGGAWWAAVHGVAKSWAQLSAFSVTFHFHALEKEMAAHSSIYAWRIPGTEEPGGLPSMGSHRVGHDWSDLAAAACTWTFVMAGEFVISSVLSHRNKNLKWWTDQCYSPL